MADKQPAEITPGAPTRASVVHSSEAGTTGSSRAHNEADISRLQSAILAYDAALTYKVGDLRSNGGVDFKCNTIIAAPEAFTPAKWTALEVSLEEAYTTGNEIELTDNRPISLKVDDFSLTEDDNAIQVISDASQIVGQERYKVNAVGEMIQSPDAPTIHQIFSTGVTGDIPKCFAVSDSFLYAATDTGLSIFDITDHDNLKLVQKITQVTEDDILLLNCTWVIREGTFIYVAFKGDGTPTNPPGVAIIDSRDPTQPPEQVTVILNGDDDDEFEGSTATASLQVVNRFVLAKQFGYFPDTANSKITVIDFNNPLLPRILAVLDVSGGFKVDSPVGIAVSGNLLYWSNVGLTTPGIVCSSIEDEVGTSPTNPKELSIISTGADLSDIGGISVQGNVTYCASGLADDSDILDPTVFIAIDYSDPTTPVVLSSLDVLTSGSGQLQVYGKYALLPHIPPAGSLITAPTFQIINIGTPTLMVIISTFTLADVQGGSAAILVGNDFYAGSLSLAAAPSNPNTESIVTIHLNGIDTQAARIAGAEIANLIVTKTAEMKKINVSGEVHSGSLHTDGRVTAAKPSATTPEYTTQSISSNETINLDFSDDVAIKHFSVFTGSTLTFGTPTGLIPGHRYVISIDRSNSGLLGPIDFSGIQFDIMGNITVPIIENENVKIEMVVYEKSSSSSVSVTITSEGANPGTTVNLGTLVPWQTNSIVSDSQPNAYGNLEHATADHTQFVDGVKTVFDVDTKYTNFGVFVKQNDLADEPLIIRIIKNGQEYRTFTIPINGTGWFYMAAGDLPLEFAEEDEGYIELSWDNSQSPTGTLQLENHVIYKEEPAIDAGQGGGGAEELNDLSDVLIDTPEDGQLLKYNSSAAKWENASLNGGTIIVEHVIPVIEPFNINQVREFSLVGIIAAQDQDQDPVDARFMTARRFTKLELKGTAKDTGAENMFVRVKKNGATLDTLTMLSNTPINVPIVLTGPWDYNPEDTYSLEVESEDFVLSFNSISLFEEVSLTDVVLESLPVVTWGASDEDSPVTTGELFTTEAALVTMGIGEVGISVKNAPTATPIEVDILQETAPNSEDFVSIFSTKPKILITEFTSFTSGVTPVFANTSWVIGNRLKIVLISNDTNFDATGLKVSLR